MGKKLLIDRDISSLVNQDDAKFFGESCRDIIKDENGYHLDKSAWIENGKLKSYHSINDFLQNHMIDPFVDTQPELVWDFRYKMQL